MIEYPLVRGHRPGTVFARRAGQAINVETFLTDVAVLAKLLPERGHVVNLCPDRYRFAVGFAAALCRNQINLLPPHDAPDLLGQLLTDYPDLYCLADEPFSSASDLPFFSYPNALDKGMASPAIPRIAGEQLAAVLFTSGSTGRPRPHARTWGELVNSALAEGQRLNIPDLGHASLLGTVPHQHSYGLESLLMLALQHGLTLHAERLFYPADIRAQIAAAPRPRMLVTTPVHLRVLLAEAEPPPPVDLVVCATAPLATHLAREAEARFAVTLHEIYGCSEAGQIAARRTALTEEWQCLDGITLRQDLAGTWASGLPIAVETLLPDVIELRDPTRFLLHGRIADMVNVAGKRTSLVHLNYHLNAIDGVRDGAFVMPGDASPDAVTRLAAFVVAPGRSAEFIVAELRRRIDVAFLPRPICLVEALPRNALGKLPHDEIQRLIRNARSDQAFG
jgi:acyl-coenzyme A synthetase/AMP-(fatty) acid ligase